MNSAFALSSTTFLYGLATVCYVGAFAFKKKLFAMAGFYVLATGLLANTVGIGLGGWNRIRWESAGPRFPICMNP